MARSPDIGGSNGVGGQGPILAKARGILDRHKLDITKSWLGRLVGKLDDLEALENFPTQESIRTSVGLIEGLIQCLDDETAIEQFKESAPEAWTQLGELIDDRLSKQGIDPKTIENVIRAIRGLPAKT